MIEFLILYAVFSAIVAFVILTQDNEWYIALIWAVCFGFILFPIAMGNAIAKINKL
jgi:hypothetical protein